MHMIQVCVWLGKNDHPDWETWVVTALAAAEKLGPAWQPISKFFRALDMNKRGDQGALAALGAVALESQDNETKATALLVLARRALAEGIQTGEHGQLSAREVAADFIRQMPEMGTQHVRAIGARLLADMSPPSRN